MLAYPDSIDTEAAYCIVKTVRTPKAAHGHCKQQRLGRAQPLQVTIAVGGLLLTVLGVVQIHRILFIPSTLKIKGHHLQLPNYYVQQQNLPHKPPNRLQQQSYADEPHRLLLATHNRLAWYYQASDRLQVLHEGEGVHYGMFQGDPLPGHPHTVWNIIRPHNWRPSSEKEYLVQFDTDTGEQLNRVEIPTRFSHDAIRIEGNVYVCSTGDGSIVQLSYPSMQLVRRMPLFSPEDHPNTLAAADDSGNYLWVLLHNLGVSDLVKVYVGPGTKAHEVQRIEAVGLKAHGLVAWGKRDLIILDSDNALLTSLDTETGTTSDLWAVPEEGKFLKGLAVLDDVAYLGISTWSHRHIRDSPDSQGELAAFDLVKRKLLWRRVVHTAGLLNIIGVPHLASDSTYRATYTLTQLPMSAPHLRSKPLVLSDSQHVASAALQRLTDAGYNPPPLQPSEYWSSGWPRMDIAPKLTDHPETSGIQLPLFHANVDAFKARLLAMPESMWTRDDQAISNVVMSGRGPNMERFKPGVEGIILLFSDNAGEVVFQFPYYDYFKSELEPILLEILGPTDIRNIIRVQLARMTPGASDIKMHQDSGGYAKQGHRIHVPIITHPRVAFEVCPFGGQLAAALIRSEPAPTPARKLTAAEGLPETAAAAAQLHSGGSALRDQRQATQQLQPNDGSRLQPYDGSISQQLQQQPCVTVAASEGLVFELNNRLPHKVSNPGPATRVHLVVDVFEEPKLRTKLPAGATCEYGGVSSNTLQQISQLVDLASQSQEADKTQLAAQVESMLSKAPGMTCRTKDGVEVVPKMPQQSASVGSKQDGSGADGGAESDTVAPGGNKLHIQHDVEDSVR